uniref:Ral transcription factor IIIC subunit 1 n=1 Tax=Sparus aurata TaxID=8175 RepID=A0A671TTZ8_SPAAU
MDPLSIVADEVALEGLDGITLPSLWIRLEGRQPEFPLKLDDSTKELIWKSLINNTDLKFYQLPQEREDVELFDRFKHIDPDTGIETRQKFSDSRKDVYPISMVQNKEGIQGSCALFKQRKDVTKNVRSESLTPIVNLQEAFERYGRKLVVVASQMLRFRTLIGSESDPDLKLSDDSYCVLERVGRARWQGELQRDLHGCSFKIDARKLHYMRKALVSHGLIGMQSHCTRVISGQQQHSILLMLKRFYVNRRSKYDILMEKVSKYLQHCPGQLTSFMVLRECLNVNERSFKRVLQYMRSAKLVDFIQHPLEELDPSAGPCTNKKGDKVLIRCVKSLKPYSGKSVADEDDDEDDDEDYDNEARRSAVPSQGRIMEVDVMSQAYHIVLSCGTKGIPKTAVGLRMNVGKLESRMLCRRMEKDGIIKGFMEDVGRQRTTKYISHKCVSNVDFQLLSTLTPCHVKSLYTKSSSSHCCFQVRGSERSTPAVYEQMCVESNRSIRLLQTPRCKKFLDQSHETYRLLRRKNLIVEAVRNFRIIEGLFPLQKMINDEEKQDGFSSKCCKKTILRLVHRLSREGLLKLYNTTIIQDGITKKVEMVVHPSIQPNDEAVTRVIEQVRFRISSSYSAVRLRSAQDERMKKDNKKKDKDDEFKPETVRGLGRSLGFQPKMPRLRLIHNFLWYLIYGHPHRQNSSDSNSTSQTAATNPGSSDPADVFADEDSWKRFVPPVRVHKDFGSGWAMIGDLLLCLPLSVFVQITQINYKVDGLEEYLNDPVKQHYLVRMLPAKMKRQLLYRRKYIFIFHENLQKLVYMGLLQFGPVEKFKEKDQVFLYLKRNSTIVDTTQAEPHYWLVTESPDKPFEKRQYTFNTAEDVENYWFDLMCVCLNTPLGTCGHTHTHTHTHTFTHIKAESLAANWQTGQISSLCLGSREVSDDGSIPGDGKGAGGLDSEFFGHLKRNWFWTNHLLSYIKQCFLFLRVCNQVDVEPATRNQQVVGGKGQKRKRSKKEVVKAPRKKRKEPKKRTPAHDEADHKALKMMTRQRVYWSIQEDSLMMLCSVASHLLNNKLKRPFIPYCGVRDLLHAEFEMSVDKTSVAVGRRTRYILKNPQTLLNYRICLAEVHQDKPLMRDCAKVFSEYVQLLRQKFSTALSPGDLTVPDTKQQLFSRFRVAAIDCNNQMPNRDTLNCTEEIHALVLENLIQSTLVMTNSQMKSSRSFQTFQLYSKYNQELLCKVFIQCRKRGLVNRRRVHQPLGPKKNRALPILPMSYQLSQSYYRCFSTRFPHPLCTDSFRFLRTPRASAEPPDVSDMLGFSLDSPGGACVVSLSLMTLGLLSVYISIPKQIVVVDSSMVKNDVLLNSLEEEDDDDDDGEEFEGKKGLEVKAHQASHTNYLMMRGYCSPGIVKRRNLNTLDNIVVESCIMRLQLRNKPAHHLFTLEDSSPLDLTKCGPSLLPSSLTKTTPPPCPSPSSAKQCDWRLIQQRGYTPQDIKACAQLRRSLDAAGENGLAVQDLCETHAHLKEPQSGRSRSLQEYMKDLKEEGQVLQVGSLGPRWVLVQHAEPWLLTVTSKPWSQSCVPSDKLKGQHNIFSMRKRSRREVPQETEEPPAKKSAADKREGEEKERATSGKPRKKVDKEPRKKQQERTDEGSKDKLVNVEEEGGKQTQPEEGGEKKGGQEKVEAEKKEREKELRAREDESVSFIGRPWRMVDGSVNRPVCKGMLEAVLYNIMSRPGLTQQTLVETYKDVLQPMALLDLVQALIHMGCVTKKTGVRVPKASLFSRPVPQATSETTAKPEEPDTVYYEPTISCCLRLSQVLPNERHWNYHLP